MKKAVCCLLLWVLLFAAFPIAARTAPVLILYQSEEQMLDIKRLLSSTGRTAESLTISEFTPEIAKDYDEVFLLAPQALDACLEAGCRVFCLGDGFSSLRGISSAPLHAAAARLHYGGLTQMVGLEDTITVISHTDGASFGRLEWSAGRTYPLWTQLDNVTYFPYYNKNDISSLALSAAVSNWLAPEAPSNLYVLIDEIYPFSNMEVLCNLADQLWQYGIPFTVSVMPVYDNLDYPAFKRYAQALRYVTAHGGALVLHEPIIKPEAMELEPLETKMEQAVKGFADEKVTLTAFPSEPYQVDISLFDSVSHEGKRFPVLEGNLALTYPLPETAEEAEKIAQKLNEKWFTFSNLLERTGTPRYLYDEEPVDAQYAGKHHVETSYTGFFNSSNAVLIPILLVSTAAFIVCLVLGYRLYKAKFRKK